MSRRNLLSRLYDLAKANPHVVAADVPWTHAEAIVSFVGSFSDTPMAGGGLVATLPVFTLSDHDYIETGRRVILGKQQIEFICDRMPFLRVVKLREFVA